MPTIEIKGALQQDHVPLRLGQLQQRETFVFVSHNGECCSDVYVVLKNNSNYLKWPSHLNHCRPVYNIKKGTIHLNDRNAAVRRAKVVAEVELI